MRGREREKAERSEGMKAFRRGERARWVTGVGLMIRVSERGVRW